MFSSDCNSLKATEIYECPSRNFYFFYTVISFKIPNIAVKCSTSFFLKAPIRAPLKRTKTRIMIFLNSDEKISMSSIEN